MRTPAALLLVAVLTLAGCAATPASRAPSAAAPSAPPASPTAGPASSEPSTSQPLLTFARRGGHCRTGSCDTTIAIERDGRVRVTLPEPQDLGTLPQNLLQPIQQQLSVADFEQLGSRPFTGECPVNFDGQELIYTFYGATGEIRLASCEVELDPEHPLFLAIETAVASVQPQ